MAKGTAFEKLVLEFLEELFNEFDFHVIEARNQKSGTQNGFDIIIRFLDEYDQERSFHFECKDYTTSLNWDQILIKIMELQATNYQVDCFFAVSPKIDISNIHHHLETKLPELMKFPVKHLTPETKIKELFSLRPEIYEQIYGEKPSGYDEIKIKEKFLLSFQSILKQKDALEFSNKILIEKANREPNEEADLKTKLDEKLNDLYDENEPIRIEYHQFRCDYKVYLEDLQDINNQLRLKIIRWQDNLRLKAKRLTREFQDNPKYTSSSFFHKFFEAASQSLEAFIQSEGLKFGDNEKLLHGVVFEIAAECSLNWKKDERKPSNTGK